MLKVYIPDLISGAPLLPFLQSPTASDQRLFQSIPLSEYDGIIVRVMQPVEADIFLVPHEFPVAQKHEGYLVRILAHAKEVRKKTLLSAYQDDATPIDIPGTIVLRPSAYASRLLPNEILMPAYIEDVGKLHGSEPLSKTEKPLVGFVGKSGFPSVRTRMTYVLKNYLLRRGVEREGTWFRRRGLAILRASPDVVLDAIERRSYSAHRKSIELPPEQARREYIDVTKRTHFTFAPKGDGNYSLRFYEALSLGRIPVLIDTDVRLPLENKIAFNEFIVRVPWDNIDRLPEYLMQFISAHAQGGLAPVAMRAREAFERFLYMPAFLRAVLTREYLQIDDVR